MQYFYIYKQFEKRENSTKQPPTGHLRIGVQGYFREPCSVTSPVLLIERLPSDIAPFDYNYAHYVEANRFYFVEDWVWAEGLWECHLQEDYLATWKSYIANTSAYIERSASEYNGAVTDRLYPATTNFNTETVSLLSSYYNIAPSGGCYVLGIINNANFATSQAGGAVTYYAMTVSQMRTLMNYLLGTGFLDDAGFPSTATSTQQLMQETAKAFINPVQYISSCTWFPFQVSDIADPNTTSIVLGYWDLDTNVATGHKIVSFVYSSNVAGNIPIHPQAANRGKYLNYSPYTRLTLHIPPFGSIPLDTSYCEIGSYLHADIYVDVITGKAQMQVKIWPDSQHYQGSAIVTEASAMFGVPIQIAQMTPDYFSAISSALSFTGGIVSSILSGESGDQKAMLSMNTVGNAIDSLMPQSNTPGVSGSFLQFVIPPVLTAQHFIITDEDNAELGRPLCKIRTINTLSGFIKCGEVSINYPCYLSEKRRIHSYLRSGFFYE